MPPSGTPLESDTAQQGLPIRLRTVMSLALLVCVGLAFYPRAVAAWQLHSVASALADYALCMAGPTGPALLRDDNVKFDQLVRRRLVSASPEDRVFEECSSLAYQLTQSRKIERLHRARAEHFIEYGAQATDRAAAGSQVELNLGALHIDPSRLRQLSENSWPFVRQGYTRLVKPTLSAREAIHPVALPKPGFGRGLPEWRARYRSVTAVGKQVYAAIGSGANLSYYRSEDDGLTFSRVRSVPENVSDRAERCPFGSEGRSFTFELDEQGNTLLVSSLGSDAAPYTTQLAPSELEVFAAACDEHGLVAALRTQNERDVRVMLCEYRRACTSLELPQGGIQARYPLDLARVQGTTVLAVASHGIVRVSSSRDNGKTWTPYSVAYDAAEYPQLSAFQVPTRLLALGERLLLYGGSGSSEPRYPLLISRDHGASFRTP